MVVYHLVDVMSVLSGDIFGKKSNFVTLQFILHNLHLSAINPLKTRLRLLYLKTQFVPRSKHFLSRL